MTRSGQLKANRVLHLHPERRTSLGHTLPRPQGGVFERYDHVPDARAHDNLWRAVVDKYHDFERVTEAETLAAMVCHVEELVLTRIPTKRG